MDSYEMAMLAVKALDDKKARDIKLLKVRDVTTMADYFVIASGTSNTHVGALGGEVDDRLTRAGAPLHRTEGNKSRDWVLLDFGGLVVHIFYPETREFYALERLWADAEEIPLKPEQN